MGTTRIEMFTDAVLAIAATLLVLDLLKVPEPGHFLTAVVDEWPSYLAYLAAFLTIAVLWLNHHALFRTIREVSPPFLLANLVLLLGIALVPWPVTLLSAAIRDGDRMDGVVASAVYTLVSLIITAGMVGMNVVLLHHPDLLKEPADTKQVNARLLTSWLTAVPVLLAVGLAFVTPLLALAVYLGRPIFYLVFSMRGSSRP